ncbi:hypothetical protein K503DRAFT_771092 [Rhizopogon vinicolor AM-OR11-026]|uniref:Uncharacterized protein n=1 Tax=Rhizopogon vinicolor AM-OR11-026 TaxID=1314800 RepID=A0A1B7MZ17_9AGAM|nr:hypothetical protein K503DRAFT_771092 [Rhizopogon vinicolor AM-OR11-026]
MPQALLDITHNSDANVSDDEDEDAFCDDVGDDMISTTTLSHDDVDMEFANNLTIWVPGLDCTVRMWVNFEFPVQ